MASVGSLVSFTSKRTGDFFQGTVYFYRPENAIFGIDSVLRTNVFGTRNLVEGCYQFSLNDIKDLSYCINGKYQQAITKREEVQGILSYCINGSHSFNPREYRHELLQNLTSTDYMSSCLLKKLLHSESNDDALLTFQIDFQSFLSSVIDRLPPPRTENRLIEAVRTSFVQLTRDVTLEILARVPRPCYPIISCVSKELKNLLNSREIQKCRRQLDKDSIYLCFDTNTSYSTSTKKVWFTLRKNEDNLSKDVFAPAVVLPDDHEWFQSSGNIFAVGQDIVLVGRKLTKVWIFDTRSSVLRQAPSMNVVLKYQNAGLVGDVLYVFGTLPNPQNFSEKFQVQAETFDFMSQTWSVPFFVKKMRPSVTTLSVDQKIYLVDRSVCYNTIDGSLIPYDNSNAISDREWSPHGMCLMDNVFYSFNTDRGIYWYHTKIDCWKEVTGFTLAKVRSIRSGKKWLSCIALKEYYGKLALIWAEADSLIDEDKTVLCTMIELKKIETEVHGEVGPFEVLGTLPNGYDLTHCVSILG